MAYEDSWCSHWLGKDLGKKDGRCGETKGIRYFATGWKCPIHTPNALRGEPEYPPGPGIPAYQPGYKAVGQFQPKGS